MINRKISKILNVVLFVFLASAAMAGVSPEGSWKYEAPNAPYEYSKGKLLVEKASGSDYSVTIVINDSKLKARNIQYSGSELTFSAYVEGEYISVKLLVEEDKMNGKVSYSEGQLDVSANKEKN
ncbi:MAG: hypothetical protein JXQ96_04980 [Cyclobacteriaceae bacterium]